MLFRPGNRTQDRHLAPSKLGTRALQLGERIEAGELFISRFPTADTGFAIKRSQLW